MPPLSTWAIRLALLYLVVGWAIGAMMMLNKAWGGWPQVWTLLGVHGALVLFGWIFQLTIGVAYWVLPTFGTRDNRGREWAAWTSVIAINFGVLWTIGQWAWGGTSGVVSALSWLVAAGAIGWHAWPRIKAFRQG